MWRTNHTDPVFPTLYAMGRIGVNDAREALEAFHFCSVECRDAFQQNTPAYTDGGWMAGEETLSVDGDICSHCNRELE